MSAVEALFLMKQRSNNSKIGLQHGRFSCAIGTLFPKSHSIEHMEISPFTP